MRREPRTLKYRVFCFLVNALTFFLMILPPLLILLRIPSTWIVRSFPIGGLNGILLNANGAGPKPYPSCHLPPTWLESSLASTLVITVKELSRGLMIPIEDRG